MTHPRLDPAAPRAADPAAAVVERDPLFAAAQKLRGGASPADALLDQLTADDTDPEIDERPAEEPDDEVEEAPEEESPDDEPEEEPGEEPEEPEEKPDDEPEEKEEPAEAKAAKGFTLSVPPLSTREKKAGVELVLEGIPQEFHDTLKAHINRSQQLDVVQETLQTAKQFETSARFVANQPLAAMLMLDDQDTASASPKLVGERFVEIWMQQHPESALKVIQKLRYDDSRGLDPDRLKERAELANARAKAAVDAGLKHESQATQYNQWAGDVAVVLRSTAIELDLPADDAEEFLTFASTRIRDEAVRRQQRGQSPLVNRSDVLKIVQSVVRRFTPNGASVAPKGSKNTQDRLETRHEVQRRTKRLAGGKATAPPGGEIVNLKKLKKAKSVAEAAAVLRQS